MMKKMWDSMADIYVDYTMYSPIPINVILYNIAKAKDAKTICEVGIGPGSASLILVNNYMQPGAHYYNSDFSPEMVKRFEKLFSASPLANNDKVKFSMIEENESIEVAQPTEGDDTRHVYATVANNESLPFSDSAFDCYIANLSLMLVNDHKKMLEEAFRVTKEGGRVAFSVIGPEEKQHFNNVMFSALKKVGIELPLFPKSPSHLGKVETLKTELESAGFKD
jgi:ubiquinone/menaquinone biosynthesis C-methylase UbiE